MRVFVALFVISMLFGLSISIVYWYSSHEQAGTVLLGFMAAALLFAAGYAVLAEREADLVSDDERAKLPMGVEYVGVFTVASVWPILVAVSVLAMLVGVIWSPVLGGAGLVALVLCLWRLDAESNRAENVEK